MFLACDSDNADDLKEESEDAAEERSLSSGDDSEDNEPDGHSDSDDDSPDAEDPSGDEESGSDSDVGVANEPCPAKRESPARIALPSSQSPSGRKETEPHVAISLLESTLACPKCTYHNEVGSRKCAICFCVLGTAARTTASKSATSSSRRRLALPVRKKK